MSAVPPWVWLATAAAVPLGILGALGILAIGACIGGTKARRQQPHPCADLRGYGPDGDDDPGDLLHEPPTGIRIHPGREAP